jgi:hypothetical protein
MRAAGVRRERGTYQLRIMSGPGQREQVLCTDATAWHDAVIADMRGLEGRIAARSHQVSIDLIIAGAEAIARYIAVGEAEISRAGLDLQNRTGGHASDRQVARLMRYLAARGFVRRSAGRPLIRPVVRNT